MKLADYISLYVPQINKEIKDFFENKIGAVENRFLKDYYTELKDYFLSGGKRIRPLLCIATFNAFSEKNDDTIIFPSIAMEFIHNASLIHDDIIDRDDYRRGKPAFHFRFKQYHEKYQIKKMQAREFGTNIGILGGDSTFFLGLEPLMNNQFPADDNPRAIRYYESVFHELCNGVLIEVDMVNKRDLTMDDYIEMISLKTGALIEKSMLVGANYARVSDEYLPHVSQYAVNLGIIFQIIDDILGTFGDEKVTGKPTDGDIREGKKTSLLIHALNNLEKSDKDHLIEIIEKPEIQDAEVEEVRNLFIKANVVNASKTLADEYYQKAKHALAKLDGIISDSEAELFQDLLDFVMNREF